MKAKMLVAWAIIIGTFGPMLVFLWYVFYANFFSLTGLKHLAIGLVLLIPVVLVGMAVNWAVNHLFRN